MFGIQLDESVDSANFSQLMVFVQYIHNKTIEKYFFCRPLETTTKASDVLKLVEDVFAAENLDWNKLGSVCTDEVRSGFLTLVKQKNPKAAMSTRRPHAVHLKVLCAPVSVSAAVKVSYILTTCPYFDNLEYRHF